jgi:hypothetical protein
LQICSYYSLSILLQNSYAASFNGTNRIMFPVEIDLFPTWNLVYNSTCGPLIFLEFMNVMC